jgi:hypothetical protein
MVVRKSSSNDNGSSVRLSLQSLVEIRKDVIAEL